MNREQLREYREIQQVHAPNMCLGASKFTVLKLLGMVDKTKHLNDFLRSPWAAAHRHLQLANCWGWKISEHNETFNKTVLPAALNDPSAHVMSPAGGRFRLSTGFAIFHGPEQADRLLDQHTPLVVGVSLHGLGQRDHFITVFRDKMGQVWGLDPWPSRGTGRPGIARLDQDGEFSFRTRHHLAMSASATTAITCTHPFFGWFR